MPTKQYQDVDFRKNRLQNIRLDPVNAFPSSPANGQVVFREDQATFYWYDLPNTEWKTLGSVELSSPAPSGIETMQDSGTGAYTIKLLIDTAVFEFDGTLNTLKLKDAAVTANKLASNAVETSKINAKAVIFAKIQDIGSMTVIGRTAVGTGVSSEVSIDNDPTMAGNSATVLTTQAAIVGYVNSKLGTFGGYVGQYDAAAAGGNFPQRMDGINPAVNLVGNMWDISVAGMLQSIPFEIGDVLIARVNGASVTNPAHWIKLQRNIWDASETNKGYIQIATLAEVSAGTDDTKAITPLKLAQYLIDPGGRYTTDLGNGIDTEFTITHNLNAAIPIVVFYDNTTNRICFAGFEVIDVDTVKVTFSSPPSVNRITVIIKPF